MYTITELLNGKFYCEVRIQDGTERWEKDTREEAVHSVIQGARVLNGSYIHAEDITFLVQPRTELPAVSAEDRKLLAEIKRGALVVMEHNDYLLKYRITRDEAETIIDIREGRARIIRNGY